MIAAVIAAVTVAVVLLVVFVPFLLVIFVADPTVPRSRSPGWTVTNNNKRQQHHKTIRIVAPKLEIISPDPPGRQQAWGEEEKRLPAPVPKLSYSWNDTTTGDSFRGITVSGGRRQQTFFWRNNTSKLPDWMKEYFEWHAEQRREMSLFEREQRRHFDSSSSNDNTTISTAQQLRHQQQGSSFRFLVLRCLDKVDKSCGGVSDRLKSLPLLILAAARSRRILVIVWTKPCLLEEFLLPQQRNNNNVVVDWRAPPWLLEQLVRNHDRTCRRLYTTAQSLVKGFLGIRRVVRGGNVTVTAANNSRQPVVCVRIQDQQGGSTHYAAATTALSLPPSGGSSSGGGISTNNNDAARAGAAVPKNDSSASSAESAVLQAAGEAAYRQIFRSVWNAMFRPSPPVAAAVERAMARDNLRPGGYAAAHLRAYYGNHRLPDRRLARIATNAVRCARQLQLLAQRQPKQQQQQEQQEGPTTNDEEALPVYFCSDAAPAVQAVRERFASSSDAGADRGAGARTKVVTRANTIANEPLHLDKAASRNASDYYDVFVDLYLLANANCISHGQGGFGRFGVLLSYNASCYLAYFTQAHFVECRAAAAAATGRHGNKINEKNRKK